MRHWPTILPAVVGVALMAGMHCFQSSILAEVPQRPTISDVSWQRREPAEGATALAGSSAPPRDEQALPDAQPEARSEQSERLEEPVLADPVALAAVRDFDSGQTMPYDPIAPVREQAAPPSVPEPAVTLRKVEDDGGSPAPRARLDSPTWSPAATIDSPAEPTPAPQVARAMPAEPALPPAAPRAIAGPEAPQLPAVAERRPAAVVEAADLEMDGSEKLAQLDDATDLDRYTSCAAEIHTSTDRPTEVSVRERPSKPHAQQALAPAALTASQRKDAEQVSGATAAAPAAVRVDLPTVDLPEASPAPIRQPEVLASVEVDRPRSEAVYASLQQENTAERPKPVAPKVVVATSLGKATRRKTPEPKVTVVKPDPVQVAAKPDTPPVKVRRPAPAKTAVAEPDPDGHDRNMMLIMALQDPDRVVRKWAAEVLAGTQDKRAVKPLIRLLDDKDWWVRRSAMYSLMQFDDPQVVAPMIEKLRKGSWKDRQVAALVLGKMKTAKALGPLIEQMGSGNSHVRTACAVALGQLGDPKAVPVLQRAMQDDEKSVRLAAKRALARIGSSEVAARDED